MVVIRNVFRLKFGKAKEGVALFKEGMAKTVLKLTQTRPLSSGVVILYYQPAGPAA